MKANEEVKGLKVWQVIIGVVLGLIAIASAIYTFGKAEGVKNSVDEGQNIKIQKNCDDIEEVKDDVETNSNNIIEVMIETKTQTKLMEKQYGEPAVENARDKAAHEVRDNQKPRRESP